MTASRHPRRRRGQGRARICRRAAWWSLLLVGGMLASCGAKDWQRFRSPHIEGLAPARIGLVVYGHEPRRQPLQTPFACGIDTGCVFGHSLTAARVAAGQVVELISVPSAANYAGTPMMVDS